ncbi:MAG: ABC transporter ATP-binding protein [Planctomycetota bacterium]|nr:ABC transporter ATP-binding protein [Planctomycetota bacterium]
MTSPMLQVDQLSKHYGSIQALVDINLRAEHGALGLLGPNGAGKSTLIKALLGLVRPSFGTVRVLDLDVSKERHRIRSRVGYMPEDESMFPDFDGIDAVRYSGRLAGLPARIALQRAHEVIDYVGLGEERYREVSTYSTGMKQRLRFAQAIIHDPEILLLDEPTNGMDPDGRREMLDLIQDLIQNHGKGLILSSHLLPDVERVCSDVAILGKGSLRVHDSIESLSQVDTPYHEVRIFGSTDTFETELDRSQWQWRKTDEQNLYRIHCDHESQAILDMVSQTGCEIRRLLPGKTSLEEIYLQTVAEAN